MVKTFSSSSPILPVYAPVELRLALGQDREALNATMLVYREAEPAATRPSLLRCVETTND